MRAGSAEACLLRKRNEKMEMTEIVLLAAGGIIFILSFLIPDKKGEVSEQSRALAKSEIADMVSNEMESIKGQVDDAVEEAVTYAMEKTERSLERLSNEKIMAVSEYSDTVLSEIHKNHEEAMFLYDMLNSKHSNLKETVSTVDRTVKEVEERVNGLMAMAAVPAAPTLGAGAEGRPAGPVASMPVASMPVPPMPVPSMSQASVPVASVPVPPMPVTSMSQMPISQTSMPEMPQPPAQSALARLAAAKAQARGSQSMPASQASSAPVASMPAPVVPVASVPAPAVPVASMPVPAMPVASMPVASMPVASMPQAAVAAEPASQNILPAVSDGRVSFLQEKGAVGRNNNERILELYNQGKSKVAIAKELGLGVGEVKLVIDLFRNQ